MSDGTEDVPALLPADQSPAPARSDPAAVATAPSPTLTRTPQASAPGAPDHRADADATRTRHPGPAIAPSPPPDDAPDSVPQVRAPQRYRLLGEHGRGGLGKVSRARDRELGRDVALKELLSGGPLHEVRFLREALITARLEHPGIVPVHEAGRWPDGTPFYTMKLVAGRPLRDLLAERKTVDDRLALLHHVIAVADAIAYAHRCNIIHRDLKPSNVIIGDFGETVVIDWGLAKDLSTSDESIRGAGPLPSSRDDDLTSVGTVMGTPAYMAPEQQRGEPVDQRADVYAIGAMLWELCSLEKLPPGYSRQRQRILRASGIDPDLVAIIAKALDADPDRRYADAGELAADLKAFKLGARIGARRYSPWGMLLHWMRRHRALALSVTAALALATAGSVLYVRNIAAERDRADAALIHSRLSEASLLLEKDATRAKELLAELPTRSPRHAYLTSLARQLAATRVLTFPATIDGVFHQPGSDTIEVLTRDHDLYRVIPATGVIEVIDHDVNGLEYYTQSQTSPLIYSRSSSAESDVHIDSHSSGNLFKGKLPDITHMVALRDAIYALDTEHNLHRISDATATIIDHNIRALVGSDHVRLICRVSNELEVVQDGKTTPLGHCTSTKSPASMAAVEGGYTVLTDERKLILVRGGHRLELPTSINGEYELAMSNTGMVALADYNTNIPWFVRAAGTSIESGPVHTSQLFSVAAGGTLAAWGYSDGTVVVFDTRDGTAWKLHGHHGAVAHVMIDADRARVAAATQRELQIWDLKRPMITSIAQTPCVHYSIEPSPTGQLVATDCNDGSVHVWSRSTGATKTIHNHRGYAYTVRWINDGICSGGREDGHVLCSNADGSDLQSIYFDARGITWLASDAKHKSLFISTGSGDVLSYDQTIDRLYVHGNVNRLAVSDDGRYLASGALDGSLVVYDLMHHRVIARLQDHTNATNDITWLDHEICSASEDASIKRWAIEGERVNLRGNIKTSAPVQRCVPVHRGWAVTSGNAVQMIRTDGSVAFSIDTGKAASALDVSPDQRYIAAVAGENIVIIDVLRSAIATLIVDVPEPRQLRFLDATTLEFSQVFMLKVARIDTLDYIQFEPSLAF